LYRLKITISMALKIKLHGLHQNVPRVSGHKDYVAIFLAVIYSLQIGSVVLYLKWQLSVVLSKVIFCYNSVKYEANFIIFLLLLEMITALNLLKRFPPHFNCIVRLLR